MKVLIIHEHGRQHGGGAVTAMYRLHAGLRAVGVDSTIACRSRELFTPDIVELPPFRSLDRLLGRFTWRFGLNDIHCLNTFKLTSFKPFLDADVINIHGWHTNYFNYLALPHLSQRKPIVGTMHDFWNLTGHCSQPYDCTRWKTGCGKCPYLDTFPPVRRDATAIEHRLKRWAYNRSNVTFVSPSKWMQSLAGQGLLANHDVRQINNPVDTDIYKPHDKLIARRRFDLPPDKFVLFFVSVALTSRAKGADLLIDAINALPQSIRDNLVLLLLGERGDEFAQAAGVPARALGYTHDDELKSLMYAAADVTVLPSRAENQPLVLIESLACGTPVVGFNVGGNAEMIRHGHTGCLAEPENPADLAQGITRILEDDAHRQSLQANCRALAESDFSLHRHVERYIELFQERIKRA